jgi:hypothetical protein
MRRPSVLALILTASIAMWSPQAFSQTTDKDVEAKIESALKDYKAGKTGEAMASLQEAVALMQKSAQKGMAAFFPKAPEGWEAGKLDSQSISSGGEGHSGSWTTLSQSFTRKKDELKVSIALANSPDMIKAQKGMLEGFKNPEMLKMMNSDPAHQVKLIDQAGWVGLRQITKGKGDDKGKAEIIVLTDACMLTLQVDSADEAVLDTFFKQIDLKGLAAAAPKAKKTEKSDSQ